MNEAQPFPVPGSKDFEDARTEFIPAGDDVEAIAKRLIATYEDFSWLRFNDDITVKYLWKDEGGQRGGASILGKSNRPSGLARYYAEADFVIWFGADHLRLMRITWLGMEALIFHELKHLALGENGPKLSAHDAEVFAREIELYGLWKSNLKYVARSFQLRLGEIRETEIE